MKHRLCTTLLLLCGAMTSFAQPRQYAADYRSATTPDGPVVIAYVTDNDRAVMPDPTVMTHINYAFGHVNNTFDGVRIGNPDRLHKISALKEQHPHLKVMLSIGGWGSGRFSEMAADPKLRKSFAKDCARVMKEFDLDGIDIDWEYPSQGIGAGISESAADTYNYTLLMHDLRKALGKKALLTLASSHSARYIDFPSILPYISFVNVMTYDMGTPPYGLHNALYPSEIGGRNSVQAAIERHQKVGIPPTMITVGLPFYGRGAKGYKDYMDYKDYVKACANDSTGLKEQGLREMWDAEGQVPYLVNEEGKPVYTLENARSLRLKCAWIKEHDFLGGMYWEYSCDDPEGTMRTIVADELLKQ